MRVNKQVRGGSEEERKQGEEGIEEEERERGG